MQRTTILWIIFAALAGFASGFFLANSLNRSELNRTRSGLASNQTVADASSTGSEMDLSTSELRAKIQQADSMPQDFAFQRNLGTALYRYAAVKQDVELMSEAQRILQRASLLNRSDVDVLVALGNAHFDMGFYKKDNAELEKARDLYREAIRIKPDDEVQTDLGISFFIQEPPDLAKAEAELRKAASSDAKHERSRQFLVQVLAKAGKSQEARRAYEELRAINPGNRALSGLDQQINTGVPVL